MPRERYLSITAPVYLLLAALLFVVGICLAEEGSGWLGWLPAAFALFCVLGGPILAWPMWVLLEAIPLLGLVVVFYKGSTRGDSDRPR